MTEVAIVNCIEKMMTERREKILESDEYIRQDVDDLKELEERYAGMNLPYMFRRGDLMIISPAWNQRVKDMQICLMSGVWVMRSSCSKTSVLSEAPEALSVNAE